MNEYFRRPSIEMPKLEDALPGREESISIEPSHYVNGRSMFAPYPAGTAQIVFGMGCFWGAERAFWSLEGAYVTSVGYAGGFTPNPSYEETCTGMTGHTEVVHVVYDPSVLSLNALLKVFWERHDPTQGMRQGNDLGSQYRSAIFYLSEDDRDLIIHSRDRYEQALLGKGLNSITTEIKRLDTYYYAESYHQQYLAKNPNGYCGLGGTGVSCA